MVGASIVLSIITAVACFAMSALGEFPLSQGGSLDAALGEDQGQSVQDVGEGFLLCYTDIIEDLASFQHDPSLERAEARRDAFIDLARSLIGKYRDLSQEAASRLP